MPLIKRIDPNALLVFWNFVSFDKKWFETESDRDLLAKGDASTFLEHELSEPGHERFRDTINKNNGVVNTRAIIKWWNEEHYEYEHNDEKKWKTDREGWER